MSLGVEMLLTSDCLNINKYGRYTRILIPMHMNIHWNRSYCLNFIISNINSPSNLLVKHTFICLKSRLISILTALDRSYIKKTRCTRGEVAQFLQYKAGDRRVASSRFTGVAVLCFTLLAS